MLFRSKTLAPQDRKQDWTAGVADYGESLPVSLASYDPLTSLWRTCQTCLTGGLAEFSATWPKSGMMRSGTVYPLASLVPLSFESDYSWLPTLLAGDSRASSSQGTVSMGRLVRIEDNGPINPAWAEWLMGFPDGWTELER